MVFFFSICWNAWNSFKRNVQSAVMVPTWIHSPVYFTDTKSELRCQCDQTGIVWICAVLGIWWNLSLQSDESSKWSHVEYCHLKTRSLWHYWYLEEKETHTYLGEVLASGVENLKIRETHTLGPQMQKCNYQRFDSQAVFIRIITRVIKHKAISIIGYR